MYRQTTITSINTNDLFVWRYNGAGEAHTARMLPRGPHGQRRAQIIGRSHLAGAVLAISPIEVFTTC